MADDFKLLSRKEQLAKRLELVGKARAAVALAEKNNQADLTAEDQQLWESYDADIEKLNELLEPNPLAEKKDRLAEMEKALDVDPGRQTEPTRPGSSGDLGFGEEFTYRGQKLSYDDDFASLKKLASPTYSKNFTKFLRGTEKPEQLGMMVGADNKGGYLASMGFVAGMIKFLDDAVLMRQLGTVIPTNGAVGMGAVSWDTDPGDGDWTPEVPATAITEDDSARVGKRELMPHGFSKLVKLSNKLRRHHPAIESFLISRLGYKAAVTEEKAFNTGDGLQKPLGVWVANNNGIPTSRDVTSGTQADFTFDDFIAMYFFLKTQYAERATWILSREACKRARKLKAATTGEYLWEPSPAQGIPSTILQRPYKLSEFCPCQTSGAFVAGAYPVMLADWSFYWIVDSLQMMITVLAELFSLQQQTGYLLAKETDGQPVLPEAFARMKLGA